MDSHSQLTISGEFRQLPFSNSVSFLCQEGIKNADKNRYNNVLPVDETRVKIASPRGDYINANFIDLDLDGKQKMIACQGPTKKTKEDFWLMVFQYEVPVILMTTKLVENGKRKCSKYWPLDSGDKKEIGNHLTLETVEKTILSMNSGSHIVVSLIKITQNFSFGENRGTAIHEVLHLYYTGWPDFGVPECEDVHSILDILKSVWTDRSKPLVCHCSAGIGRTGTWAAILRILNTGEEVMDSITKVRKQRHGMVQTAEQFKFVRDFINSLKTRE